MHERNVRVDDVRHVVETGEVILSYPDDTPFPSRLLLGRAGGRPLHVLIADNPGEPETVVITVYEPSPDLWDEAFRQRRKP